MREKLWHVFGGTKVEVLNDWRDLGAHATAARQVLAPTLSMRSREEVRTIACIARLPADWSLKVQLASGKAYMVWRSAKLRKNR